MLRCYVLPALVGVLLAAPFNPPARAQGASFEGLGDLPGGAFQSVAIRVSADGSVVVGEGESASGQEAFRWTAATEMVGLGDLPGADFYSSAYGVSADGSVVVGTSRVLANFEAFRWTQTGGMVGLGFLPNGFLSSAYGASADGSVVVGGGGVDAGIEAFRWTQAGGLAGLGDLPGGDFASEARAVSADGLIVVGTGAGASGNEAFRWTQTGGMVGLGDLPGTVFYSSAYGVSADGAVVVGFSFGANGQEAFRWTQAGGMVGLGDFPGGRFFSFATDVSADGSVVVGVGASASSSEPFIWTEATGMVSLRESLIALGLDLTGWTLGGANGVSADGRTVVGSGINPDGQSEAWRAVLSGGFRWVNPNGGAWDTAANWSSNTVPDADDAVTFDLDATYTVTGAAPRASGTTAGAGGGRRALRLAADDGRVDFALDNLTLTATTLNDPSLSVSFDATAKVVAGASTVFDAIVGYGAATDPNTVARLQVFNAGTTLTASGFLLVGLEGRGEVFVAAGHLTTLATSLGGDSDLPATPDGIGELIVGNEGTFDTGFLSVGREAAGTVRVEEGGAVTARTVFLGGDPGVLGFVEVGGVAPSGTRSRLFVTETISVGDDGRGELDIRDGGEVTADRVEVGFSDSPVSSAVVVRDVEDGLRATLVTNRLVVGAEASGDLNVENGGLVEVNELFVGTASVPGSVLVTGTSDSERAELVATVPGFGGRCLVGGESANGTAATLSVDDGGYVRCDAAEVGDTEDGFVLVGATGTADSLVVSRVLTLGSGAPGTLRLSSGAVVDAVDAARNPPPDLADVVVSGDGRIEGTGVVMGRVLSVGFIGPGVSIVAAGQEGVRSGTALDKEARGGSPGGSPGGVLVVRGAFAQEAGARLEIPLAGPDSTQQGRLRVRPTPGYDGSAALAGTLRLVFQDGYAPRTGDTFAVLDAASTSGAFDATEVTGLEPGWEFALTIEGGAVVVTSLNDGAVGAEPVPEAPPTATTLHVPYPNPSASRAVLGFDLAEAGRVRLAVYDALGREVAVVVDAARPAGSHEATLDGARLPAGVYLVRMTTGTGFTQTRRLTLLR